MTAFKSFFRVRITCYWQTVGGTAFLPESKLWRN